MPVLPGLNPEKSQNAKNAALIKLLVVLAMLVLILSGNAYGEILHKVLITAYLSVAVFVAMTLVLIYGLERLLRFDLGRFNHAHSNSQVLVASLLGVLPGCGGSIIVLTQYVTGHMSFGAVVATLIGTMGDAAFLLIAKEPMTALFVMGISFVAANISGLWVDWFHGRDFMAVKQASDNALQRTANQKIQPIIGENLAGYIAFLSFLPGIVLGFLLALQIDVPDRVENIVGIIGIFSLLLVWIYLKDLNPMVNYAIEVTERKAGLIRRAMDETAFIVVWVIAAFFLYESVIHGFDIQLEALFARAAWALPLIGILIGFIPGCGPQIVVTTLYINGIVPLSTQLGNAISNDGDALFPAIAMAPKAAVLATLYSAVPAFIIAYGYFFLFE